MVKSLRVAGGADVDVKGVDDGLPEVLAHGGVSQRGEVDAVEVLLVPEVHLSHIGSDDEGHVENVDQEYKDTCRCQTLQSW